MKISSRVLAFTSSALLLLTLGFMNPASAQLALSTDPNLTQVVQADESVVEGEKVELGKGHVDMGPRLIDGTWQLVARDDTQHPAVWRRPEDVVFRVNDSAKLTVPADPAYEFLNAEAGSEVYVIGQTEIPNVIWLGWNTQDPAVIEAVSGGVNLNIKSVTGPGNFALYLQPGNFAQPQILATTESLASKSGEIYVELNTHTHANWVFTEPGIYLIEIEAVANSADTNFSDLATFAFAVGDEAPLSKAQEALAASTSASQNAATEDEAAGETQSSSETEAAEPAQAAEMTETNTGDLAPSPEAGNSLVLIIGAIFTLALAAALALIIASRRSKKGEAKAFADYRSDKEI